MKQDLGRRVLGCSRKPEDPSAIQEVGICAAVVVVVAVDVSVVGNRAAGIAGEVQPVVADRWLAGVELGSTVIGTEAEAVVCTRTIDDVGRQLLVAVGVVAGCGTVAGLRMVVVCDSMKSHPPSEVDFDRVGYCTDQLWDRKPARTDRSARSI